MGRHLNRNQSQVQFEKYYRGCIWGLLPLHFHSFKNLMPNKSHKHERSSNSKSGPKTQSKETDSGQVFEVGNSDSSYTAKENTRKDISILASKEDTHRKGQVPRRPRLRRTYSIHHLEPSSDYLNGLNVDHMTKISSASRDMDQIAWDSEHFGEQEVLDHDAVDEYQSCSESGSSSDTFEDFFDAFKIDKKLFLKNTQKSDADDSDNYQGILKSNMKVTLKRSGSFPAANKCSISYGSLAPSKLEDKLTEVWPSSSSSSSSFSSFHSSDNMLPRSRSMVYKSPMDLLGELIPDKSSQDGSEHNAGDYAADVRKYKLSRIRRASSLKESLERYTQLFETSFRRDAKLNNSKSLRLSNEVEVGPFLSDSVFLRKVHSMREPLQIEGCDSIELHKVPNESPTFITESCPDEQSDSVSEDESCASFEHQLGCASTLEPILLDEAQKKSDSEPKSYSQQHLNAEDTKAADSNPDDDFFMDNALATEDSIEFRHVQNALNQLEGILRTSHSPHKSTGLNNDIDEQLLSDLVNEAVLNYRDGYHAYWPTVLCSNCHMHPPPPTEQHVSQKVQLRIQRLHSFTLKPSNTLDSIIAYDLAHTDGWMNLQADAESLGLALDEMIFDELIEELMYE
ncbi:unnamed protein product [Rhodiola kirilowii]